MNAWTPPTTIEIDVDGECPIREILEPIAKNGGKFSSSKDRQFVVDGPGGGNPCLYLTFPTDADAQKFIVELYGPDGDVDLELYRVK